MTRTWSTLMVLILLAALAAVAPADPVQAAGVVGTGIPDSCDEEALATALAGGGLVTFNCGRSPVTIPIMTELEIAANTQVDGGGLITLDGQLSTRIFYVPNGVQFDLNNIALTRGNSEGQTLSGGGGAILNEGGTVTLTSSTVSDSVSAFGGGAITSFEGSLEITDSTLSGNRTTLIGGAIFSVGGLLRLTNTTVSDNATTDEESGGSGGIADLYGTVTIINSTISDNHALGFSSIGGGIIVDSSDVTIINSTLSGNSAATGGGIHNAGGGNITLQNTIVANTAGVDNCFGAVTSLGGNLSDDASCTFDQPGDVNDTEDGLGPLGDHGGPTHTHLPGEGSAAIDGAPACAVATDQRGVERPVGAACDIGSVEVRPSSTYALCVSRYTGALTPQGASFCIDPYTGQVTYAAGRPCSPPQRTHTVPDDGDLLTCASRYTGANRWVPSHSMCTAAERPNTIVAMP